MLVRPAPVGPHEARHQEQQGALWLVEVGDEPVGYPRRVAWRYEQIGGGVQRVGMRAVQMGEQSL